jgi:DNA-directed RNA polymerase subunit RPC12/RpoP
MAIYDFLCLDCGEQFEVDSTKPIEGTQVRCANCDSAHVRQTFESYVRQAKAAWSPRHLDELRCNHFG